MPRQGRLHITGGYYHVLGRGLERRAIFSHKDDKVDFLARLDRCLEQTQAQCLAWAVMSNHYHLLIRAGKTPLSKLMGPLLGGYAGSYNRRHRRAGYVFQNRYKSVLCDADSYLLQLVRYIHLNPVKAKILRSLSELDRYPWTGHAGLLGKHRQPWQETEELLSLFDPRLDIARSQYREFVEEGLRAGDQQDLSGGGLIRSYGGWEAVAFSRKEHVLRIGDERILGDSSFVELALREDEIALQEKTRNQRQGIGMPELIDCVCKHYNISREQLCQKGRSNDLSLVKALICFWGTSKLGITTRQLANKLGISQPAVSKLSKKGRDYCLVNKLDMKDLE